MCTIGGMISPYCTNVVYNIIHKNMSCEWIGINAFWTMHFSLDWHHRFWRLINGMNMTKKVSLLYYCITYCLVEYAMHIVNCFHWILHLLLWQPFISFLFCAICIMNRRSLAIYWWNLYQMLWQKLKYAKRLT